MRCLWIRGNSECTILRGGGWEMWREDLCIIHYRQPGALHKGPHVPSLTWMKRYSTAHHMHLLESRWQERATRGLSLIQQPPHSPLSVLAVPREAAGDGDILRNSLRFQMLHSNWLLKNGFPKEENRTYSLNCVSHSRYIEIGLHQLAGTLQ